MSDCEINEDKELKKFSDRFMDKEIKEEVQKLTMLQNSKSELQFIFGQNLKKICKEKKIKGEEKIREQLEISPSDLSEYISGKKQINLKNLDTLADKLNVSPYYLLGVTDNPKPISPILSNMICGLSLEARYSFIMLYYGLEDNEEKVEIVDDELGEIEIERLPNGSMRGNYFENFAILSSFIADFSNFCDFFTYIKRYFEIRQEINELITGETNSSTLEINRLDEDMEEIKRRIQKSIFESLDKIADKN